MYPGLHSMRQILKQYGRGSRLVLALKEIINSPQWINAWINVLFTDVTTWMYVTANFWKKGKKQEKKRKEVGKKRKEVGKKKERSRKKRKEVGKKKERSRKKKERSRKKKKRSRKKKERSSY